MTSASVSYARKVFLVDGLGAVVSAFMHGVVLTQFESIFGWPRSVLLTLAAIAACFAVYSLSCSFLIGAKWRPFLRGIAVANLTFCAVSAYLIFYFYSRISALGLLYFVGEILIVTALALFELRVASRDRTEGVR